MDSSTRLQRKSRSIHIKSSRHLEAFDSTRTPKIVIHKHKKFWQKCGTVQIFFTTGMSHGQVISRVMKDAYIKHVRN
jgi:hypothetical protein